MKSLIPEIPRRTLWLSALALVVACGSDESPTAGGGDPLPAALEATVDLTIIPTMERFAAEASAFDSRATAFCAAPTSESLSSLHDQWLLLAGAWNEAMVYFLGPLDDDPIVPSINFVESMRPRGTDYTNTVRDEIQRALADTSPLDEDYFSALPFNQVGLLALEVLVFEDTPGTGSTMPADVLAGYVSSPRKCEYLEGMATLLNDRGDLIASSWTVDYADTGAPYRDLILGGVLEDGFESVAGLVRAAARHLEYLRDRKLDGILDAQLAGAARPEPTPFWENLSRGLDSIEAMLEPEGSETSFFAVMSERGFEQQVQNVREGLEAARAAVDAEDRAAASAAFLELEENSLRGDVVRGLNLNLGIGFGDGD